MTAIIHSLSTLWLRFRWEILGCLLLLLGSALGDIGNHGYSAPLGSLTILAFFWITLRIALSETGFKTHGGWQTRPFNPRTVLSAQLLLLAVLMLATCLVRFVVLQWIFRPGATRWLGLLKDSFLAEFLPWAGFVFVLKGFAFLLLRPLEGHARRAAWAAMVIVLVPVLMAFVGGSRGWDRGGTGRYPENLSQGIRRELPEATEFIGMWNESVSESEVPVARLFARIPLESGQPAFPGDLHVAERTFHAGDRRIHLNLELLALNPLFLSRLGDAVPVLAYRGGYYGSAITYQVNRIRSRGIIGSIPKLRYRLEFASPLCLPENRSAGPADFPPTEVLFFVPGSSRLPAETGSPGSSERGDLAPPLAIPLPEIGAPFDLAVRQLIDSYLDRNSPPDSGLTQLVIDALPRQAIAPILAYHPWPDLAWEKLVRPFLLEHATETEKPALLERLADDSRLASVFVEKGWSADAIPVLKARAKERLPLEIAAIKLLAEQNDPALADDLAALAIRHSRGVGDLAPILRDSTGFDWPGFVASGWKSRKYGNYEADGWLYAKWAAELGDPSALLRLAEKVAEGKEWERDELAKLIPSAPADLVGFLRGTIDELNYDPSTRTWSGS